jgi:2-dehydropantoate 2-reductase
VTILVIGAGIIGTIYGWALSEGGHKVVHLVRRGKAAPLSRGVTMDVYDRRKRRGRYFRGTYRLSPAEAISPADRFELVVVPTKHFNLESALAQVVPQAGTADFLLLTQNWRGTGSIDAALPQERYVFGDAKAGGTFSNGILVSTLASIDLGPAEGEPTPLTRKVAGAFGSAGIPATLHKDMLHYLWVQYAITGGLWPALVRAGSMDAVLRDRRAGEQAASAVRECLEVVARRGVDLGDYPEAQPFLSSSAIRRWIAAWMIKLALRYSEFAKRASAHALDDPEEIKVFYDDLVSTGADLGVPMPAMNDYGPDIASFAGQKR